MNGTLSFTFFILCPLIAVSPPSHGDQKYKTDPDDCLESRSVLPRRSLLKDLSTISAYGINPLKGETGTISYYLQEPARVRIVITEQSDPDQLYRVLFWGWQDPGKQSIVWDGRDQSGQPVDPKRCAIRTRTDAKSNYRPDTVNIKPLTTAQLVAGQQGAHDHNRCDPAKCKPGTISITGFQLAASKYSPTSGVLNPGTFLSGIATITAEVAPDGRGYGDLTGYGVRWMVGHQLVSAQYYERESDGKFSYRLDTTAFRDGKHTIRVSSCDHYDHTGVVSVPVVFKNR